MSNAPDTTAKSGKPASGKRLLGLSPASLKLGMIASTAILGMAGLTLWLLAPTPATPAQRLQEALNLLDRGRTVDARNLAKALEEEKYTDPDFPGGLDFVQGMAGFKDAELIEAASQRTELSASLAYLLEADRRSMPEARRAELEFAIGKSLYLLEQSSLAQRRLKNAIALYPKRRGEAAGMLAEIYLDPAVSTPERIDEGLELNSLLLEEQPGLKPALLQRAELFLIRERLGEARQQVQAVLAQEAASTAALVMESRILLAERRYPEAIRQLETASERERSDPTAARQAMLLLGLAHERMGERFIDPPTADGADAATLTPAEYAVRAAQRRDHAEAAMRTYRRVIDRFERTSEAQAASLFLADLLRVDDKAEAALQAYGRTLRSTRHSTEYRNRWVTVDQMRERVVRAWHAWIVNRRYAEAILLAEMLTPLVPREQAYGLSALAKQRSVEHLAEEVARERMSVRDRRAEELRQAWNESGAAYARLAEVCRDRDERLSAHWTASEHYRSAGAFDLAIEQINLFLKEEPANDFGRGLVRHARLSLDVDRPDAALDDLRTLLSRFPSDPLAFEARWLTGVCYLEKNDTLQAERIWREMLSSDTLSPAAAEWRDALLSLGELLDVTAAQAARKAEKAAASERDSLYLAAETRWKEATDRLQEYLVRYPAAPATLRTRRHLAQSQQGLAGLAQRQLDAAATQESRQRLRAAAERHRVSALEHYRTIQESLQPLAKADLILPHDATLLRFADFEIAHLLTSLGRYDDAIVAYGGLVNRYPTDPQILTCYVQMAGCHRALGRNVEARSFLEQARLVLNQKQIADADFSNLRTAMTQSEWEDWLQRTRQAHP